MENRLPVVILCGGEGTRLAEMTEIRPKPLVEIGGRPILWHIMKQYSCFGFNEFILALGYKGEQIKRYFLEYNSLNRDFTVSLEDGTVSAFNGNVSESWKVHLIDTGAGTGTGGRLKKLTDIIGNRAFMMTYGDGVSDVNLHDLLSFHKSHSSLVTLTAVRPQARFGALDFDGDIVRSFTEKSQLHEGWINGGFFVIEAAALEYIDGEAVMWEQAPLKRLSQDRMVWAYKHEGFWQCMDNIRDLKNLQALWDSGNAPWKIW